MPCGFATLPTSSPLPRSTPVRLVLFFVISHTPGRRDKATLERLARFAAQPVYASAREALRDPIFTGEITWEASD
eukprot:m.195298 g.195298  ORF g.195298 m.195298 type:complete len:75 (-) comp15458_c2_seq9:96-320(-)